LLGYGGPVLREVTAEQAPLYVKWRYVKWQRGQNKNPAEAGFLTESDAPEIKRP
jgi:hypothetical protein